MAARAGGGSRQRRDVEGDGTLETLRSAHRKGCARGSVDVSEGPEIFGWALAIVARVRFLYCPCEGIAMAGPASDGDASKPQTTDSAFHAVLGDCVHEWALLKSN